MKKQDSTDMMRNSNYKSLVKSWLMKDNTSYNRALLHWLWQENKHSQHIKWYSLSQFSHKKKHKIKWFIGLVDAFWTLDIFLLMFILSSWSLARAGAAPIYQDIVSVIKFANEPLETNIPLKICVVICFAYILLL